MKRKGYIATVLLGSAVTVAGLAAFVYLNDSAREKVEGMINREKAKSFVKNTLHGSDALVSAVDHLDDAEINTLMKFANQAGNLKDKTGDAFGEILDRAKKITSDATSKVSDYFD
ncbi:hypothetical protein GIY11_06465 [Aerococcaceae bacterium DSM 109653]|uniref:Uncharacterized protein n=1 Tax=Fundicoccus ignavus TaxID=2664442 RepID=A0A844BN86_9LACT|nr:hypothetical protein [Fundicoccus ignavus]MRI81658.1 hypothetical protein [Fundicoccus ignavus]